MPAFGTLIALLHRGRPILGIIDQPVTRERWTGSAGRATTLHGLPARAAAPPALAAATLANTTHPMFAPGDAPARFKRLHDRVRFAPYRCPECRCRRTRVWTVRSAWSPCS